MRYFMLVCLTGLAIGGTANTIQAAVSDNDIQQAAQVFCDALTTGKNLPSAQEAATEYLLDRINKSEKVNPKKLRLKVREAVIQRCPTQAQKLKESR